MLRTAWRHLTKNRTYTIINIVGLSLGMTTALLIGLWIADELSFGHYSPNHSRIAEVMTRQTVTKPIWGSHASPEHPEIYTGRTISTAIAPALRAGAASDVFSKTAFVTYPSGFLLSKGDKSLTRHGVWAQSTLPEIFGFQLIAGTAASLDDPNTLLLNQSTAAALFGDSDNALQKAIGTTIRINSKDSRRVGGIFADLPANTLWHNEADVILSWNSQEVAWLTQNTDWGDHSALLYALLKTNATYSRATARIKSLPVVKDQGRVEEVIAYPLDRLRLHNDEYGHNKDNSRLHDLNVFATVGAFVLLLACINFMNLSTARSEKRAKEVAIRKTIGSLRSQLIAQFLSESLLTALLAFAAAILLSALALPGFNALSGKSLVLPWTSLPFWTVALVFTALTGLLAGSYPAFYLSSFSPIRMFIRRTGLPRKILVTTQFTVSLSLIICTIVIFRQIAFAKDRVLGYDNDHLITAYINTDTLAHQSAALRNDLLRSAAVTAIAESSQTTTGFDNGNGLEWLGQTEEQKGIMFHNVNVDPDFGKTVRWTVREGRDFSRDYATDSSAMVLNEAAVKAAGFKDPIGRTVQFFGRPYHIIGVVGDMLTNSPYEQITPALFIQGNPKGALTLRLAAGLPTQTALARIEKIFKRYNPESPFLYSFNDEDYAKKFDAEARQGNITVVLSTLAIFISCLGLFALASFVAEQRTKEIGVRKVLGAPVPALWALLSKDFVKLTLLSMLIAMPLTALLMTRWLEHYTYRAPLSWWIFGASGAGILLLTLATVSFQSLKAALANPVHSLRVTQ